MGWGRELDWGEYIWNQRCGETLQVSLGEVEKKTWGTSSRSAEDASN